jgi:hypothetical protein
MSSVTILNLMEIVTGTSTNTEGLQLFIQMDNVISKGGNIIISLEEATALSSSFLNSSFGELFEKYGYTKLRNKIKIVNYQPSRLKQITEYINRLCKMAA